MSQTVQNRISQLRRKEGKHFLTFRKLYFPHYNKLPDAHFHIELSHSLEDMAHVRGSKNAIAAPRESAKSTIISLQYVIYGICYKLEEFILLISNTSEQAASLLSHIKQELETNEELMRDFPNVCEIGTSPKPPRWTKNDIITRNGIKILALGTGQQVRGRRNKEFRPSLIILDDIENDENAQNPETYEKLYDWITKSVLKSGTAKTNVIFIGTIHHYHSLLARFTNPHSSSGWNKKIYRSVISWSASPQLWEQWVRVFNNLDEYEGDSGVVAAKRFFEDHKEAMLEGTSVLWSENKSYYDLMVMREQDGIYSFDSEMQNEPIDPRNCYFNPEEMHFWDDKFMSEEELIAAVDINAIFYGACDPSLGRQNRHGDFSAIVTALLDSKSGKIYVLDADIERRKPDKTIEDILVYQRARKYTMFGFETNQFQEYMAEQLKKMSEENGCYLPLEEIKHATDKKARIEAIQPLVKNGTILFSHKHRTLLEQMKFFPKGSYDDGLDALEMVFNLCQKRSGGAVLYTLDYDVYPDQHRRNDGYSQHQIRVLRIPEPTEHRSDYG